MKILVAQVFRYRYSVRTDTESLQIRPSENTMKTSKVDVAKLMSGAASMKNPPKGYGSIETGMKVAKYRAERLAYWRKAIGGGVNTDEVFANAQADVIAEWGNPF